MEKVLALSNLSGKDLFKKIIIEISFFNLLKPMFYFVTVRELKEYFKFPACVSVHPPAALSVTPFFRLF